MQITSQVVGVGFCLVCSAQSLKELLYTLSLLGRIVFLVTYFRR